MNAAAGTTATPGGAACPERILENILETAEAARAGATARRVGALGAPGEGLEAALLTKAARLAAEAFKALGARLALGIDLAGIERLALVLVADDLIAALSSAKRDAALIVLASGCSFFGKLRKALLTSAALALRTTPRI